MRVQGSWAFLAGLMGLAIAVAAPACRGGCGGDGAGLARPALGRLAGLPAETRIVVGLDFARLRRAPLWTRLAPLATSNPDDQRLIQDFARRTGLDPMRQINSLTVAFPEEARRNGEMALVLRGSGFDEARLIAYARDQVKKQGDDDLLSFRRGGYTLWATRREPTTSGFFPDRGTFVLGAGGWAEKIVTLLPASPPVGAETNQDLVHLVERAGPTRPVWAVAVVPASIRASLAADPRFATVAGVSRLALGIDVDAGLEAHLFVDLATHEQAETFAHEIADTIRTAKKDPRVLLLGVGPYLDGISTRTAGPSSEVTLRLPADRVGDVVDRLRAVLSLARQGAVPGFPRP